MKLGVAAAVAAIVSVALVVAGPLQAAPSRYIVQTSTLSLTEVARVTALSGGVTGTCYGCSTPSMKALMRSVYMERFAPAGQQAQRIAVCLMMAESQGNPGAVSSGGDHGGPQVNKPTWSRLHPDWFAPGRGFRVLLFDPDFGAGIMWTMSRHGTSWSPWTGTWGRGLCRNA